MCTSYSCKNSWTELMAVIKTRDLPLTTNFQDESALASDEGGFQHIGAKGDISRDLEAQWRDILDHPRGWSVLRPLIEEIFTLGT